MTLDSNHGIERINGWKFVFQFKGAKKKKNLILYVYDINIVLTSSSPVFATLFDVDFAFQSPPVLLLCSAHWWICWICAWPQKKVLFLLLTCLLKVQPFYYVVGESTKKWEVTHLWCFQSSWQGVLIKDDISHGLPTLTSSILPKPDWDCTLYSTW